MSRLNQEAMQQILAKIFGVDVQYIVPKQGNWSNPTGMENSSMKPGTWCAYRLERHSPVTLSHYRRDTEKPKNNWSVQHKRSRLVMQFVGDKAEDVANSVGHWPQSQGVRLAFDEYAAGILPDIGDVVATEFGQQGTNTVLAYNVVVNIIWADEIDSKQGPMPDMVFEGEVNT